LWARIGVVVTKRNAEELQIVGEDTRGMDKKPSEEARKSSKNFKIVVFQRLQSRWKNMPHNKPKREGGRGVKPLKITKNY
jgi:hypothetical protein